MADQVGNQRQSRGNGCSHLGGDARPAAAMRDAIAIAAQIRATANASQLRAAADRLEVLSDAAGLHGTIPQYTLQDELMAAADRLRAIADAHDAVKGYSPASTPTADHGNKLTIISHPTATATN